ncbi:uncharacterized protein PAC_17549 [Phialocephala subalpina]|uniref:Uncharacterized protein n=1 Tax=Phialocephala subalpina TaxID=576137 RepID=A0A1L7XRI8_9HELO|nr:uncharacterized protein PAC_17549 [Phialocephala subalpina]
MSSELSGWITIGVLSLIIVALLAAREDSSKSKDTTLATTQISLEEQYKNMKKVAVTNRDLARRLREEHSKNGDSSKAKEFAKELEAVKAQLQATESVLHDTQSKLIVLEHGKSSGVESKQESDGPTPQSPRKRFSGTRLRAAATVP